MTRHLVILAVLALAAGTAPDIAAKPKGKTKTKAKADATTPKAHRSYVSRLKSKAQFLLYSKEVAGERYTKFVLDVRNGRIYFFDVNVYPVHKVFVFAKIYRVKLTRARHREFTKNYGKEKPEFILGYIVHHLVPDIWTMSLWEGDRAQPQHIQKAFKRLKKTFFNYKKLKFRPDSTRQERMAFKLKKIPVITNDKVYQASDYAAFNIGQTIGRLRIIAPGKGFNDLTFGTKEVVILPDSLSDITPVAGIISETFSTPLSHVNLRAKSWNIPNVGLKRASFTYKALDGKLVLFEAGHKGHTLRIANQSEVDAWNQRITFKKRVVIPHADLSVRSLRALTQLSSFDVGAYGAKSANLGVVAQAKIKSVTVPAGFGVPIAFYNDHIKKAGVDTRYVRNLIRERRFVDDAKYRRGKLAELRKKIREAPLHAGLLANVMTRVKAIVGDNGGVFVRSSTNAEDLPGFNGAGLYDTVPNAMGAEAISKGIRRVWASVWNFVAFEERVHFGIKHEKVYGAVLIQKAISPTAAGVLVTKHPNNASEKTTYTINAKSGLGIRVVNGKKIPETVLYDYKNGGLRVLSRSDEDTMLVVDPKGGVKEVPIKNPGKPVLSDRRARKLGKAARRIEKLFAKLLKNPVPLDIEWLFENKTLHIVQVRPLVVHAPNCPCKTLKSE